METCIICGAVRDRSDLTWVAEKEPDGRTRWLCPACARQHVRDIEAKLPHEWW